MTNVRVKYKINSTFVLLKSLFRNYFIRKKKKTLI